MRERVLIVDDDKAVRSAIARELNVDFNVLEAASHSGAWAILERSGIDAIVCDQNLGTGPQGPVLLAEVRDQMPELLRFMVSGSDDQSLFPAMMATGAAHSCFRIPWEHNQIRDALLAGLSQSETPVESVQARGQTAMNWAARKHPRYATT